MHRGASGEDLPPFHRHIDISGVELDPAADAAGHFGRDQAGAGAEKRVIDPVNRPRPSWARRPRRLSFFASTRAARV